jgi:hypothetical protein
LRARLDALVALVAKHLKLRSILVEPNHAKVLAEVAEEEQFKLMMEATIVLQLLQQFKYLV